MKKKSRTQKKALCKKCSSSFEKQTFLVWNSILHNSVCLCFILQMLWLFVSSFSWTINSLRAATVCFFNPSFLGGLRWDRQPGQPGKSWVTAVSFSPEKCSRGHLSLPSPRPVKIPTPWTSLVVQWLRLHAPNQCRGPQVRPLVRELDPTCCN